MDLGQRRLAERRLLAALRRLHRREPLKPDLRTDALLAEVRADPGERRPDGHRGGGSLRGASDAELVDVLGGLAGAGKVVIGGRRVRLADHEPTIADPQMQARVRRLLSGLRETGAQPPRVEGIAARLGIPPGVVDQLRRSGALVAIGDGIDYPREVLDDLLARMGELAAHGPLTVPRVRDALRTSRRHAEALLRFRRARSQRDSVAVR